MKLEASFAYPFEKYSPDSFPGEILTAFTVYAAGNEREGCQLLLRSDTDLCGLTADCTLDGQSQVEVSVYLEKTVTNPTKDGKTVTHPDGLIPLGKNDGFSLTAGKTQGLYIRFDVPVKTLAGERKAVIRLTDGKKEILSLPILLHVWNFSYSEATACTTAVGLYPEFLEKYASGPVENLYKTYYDTMLANRVCPYTLPYDLLDSRADAYMNCERVTGFCVPYDRDDDTIRAYYRKLSSNPVWMDKAYFYPVDEPTTPELMQKLKDACKRLERLFPGYQIVVPYFTNITLPDGREQMDVMAEDVNIWCPKMFLYTDPADLGRVEGAEAVPVKDSTMAERLRLEQAGGDKVWWYVCWEPSYPYANLFTDMQGFFHRFLFWQQKMEKVDGFLYWGADYWKYVENPWESMETVPDLSKTVSGDGSLLYPGAPVGFPDAALSSLRLEAVRDGIEDFELLSMAEKAFGREYVQNKIAKMYRSVCEYTHDGRAMMELRRSVAEDLEKTAE